MIRRGIIYRKFLKAKGRYTFLYAMNLTTLENAYFDEPHSRKRMIDWILQGDEVIFRCGFAWDMNRGGWWKDYGYKERCFTWDKEKGEFELIEEETCIER